MSSGWKLVLVVVVLVIVWLLWGGSPSRGKAPDDRLAAHYAQLCVIAEKGAERPRKGVEKLFRFYGEHAPAIAHDFAELVVLIERIEDERAHDQRARAAARRMYAPLRSCERALQRFGRAIESDREAQKRLERGLERLSRTLEILLGGPGRRAVDLVLPYDFQGGGMKSITIE